MEAVRWNRIESLLQQALDLQPYERSPFLDRACGSDRELRREVDSLLARQSQAEFLTAQPFGAELREARSLTGSTIGHYRVAQRIGAGGMGEVYEAYDERLQRVVALKALSGPLMSDPERIRRFEQEAFAASRLNHPNIVTIFEIVQAGDAHLIATERIDGVTLRSLLTSPLPLEKSIDVAMQIAAALQAAHTSWIIHRDIKPENVMIRHDGVVKVVDFGIAKLTEEPDAALSPIGDAPAASNMTVPGAVLGTANYMSPEQSRGEVLDGRTDIYSFGLVVYEMVAGEPFGGHVDHASKALQPILRKMLAADRELRYSSAAEVATDLQAVRRRMESRNARRMIALGALAVIVAIAVLIIAATLSVNEQWDERVLRDGHAAAARQVVFSPDGRSLVSAGEDGKVIVWDVARRVSVAVLDRPAHKVAFDVRGNWFATGATNGDVIIWDSATRRPLRVLRDLHAEITVLSLSADGTRLIAASLDDHSAMWSTATWATLLRSRGCAPHGNYVFSRDLDYVRCSSGLRGWDLTRGQQVDTHLEADANWLALSPDGNTLAAVDTPGEVSFYRVLNHDLRRLEPIARLRAHQDHGRAIAFSPDGRLVASAGENIILWDAARREKLTRFETPSIVWSLAFSPDGRWLASSHGDGSVLLWDIAERALHASLSDHQRAVRAVAFSHDGRYVASAGEDRSIIVWQLDPLRKDEVFAAHDTRVNAVAFAGERTIASGDMHGKVVVSDRDSHRSRVIARPDPVMAMAYTVDSTRDGSVIATSYGVYRARDGAAITVFYAGPQRAQWRFGQTYGVAFFPDDRRLAVVTDGGWLIVLDSRNGRHLATSHVRGTRQIAVDVSADGTMVVTGEDQGAVRLWSASPLRELRILGSHRARVKSVAFSPDGKTVASAGDDKTVMLWHVDRGGERARIGTHASPVYSVAFAPNGRRLVSGEHDGSVRVYTRRRELWGFDLN